MPLRLAAVAQVRPGTQAPDAERGARFQAQAPAISLVVPLYNEAGNLVPLIGEIRCALDGRYPGYEILLVDDGSTDGSAEILRRLARGDRRIRPLFLPRRSGQSAALCAGLAAARGPVVVTLDADLQNDPADIPLLLERMGDADVVSGIRTTRRDSRLRRVSSAVANRVRRLVLGDSIQDIGCSLKAYRAGRLRGLPQFDGLHRFLPAIVQLGGARVVEVPVRHRRRRHGTSKYGVNNRLWRGLADLLAVRWMLRRGLRRGPGS